MIKLVISMKDSASSTVALTSICPQVLQRGHVTGVPLRRWPAGGVRPPWHQEGGSAAPGRGRLHQQADHGHYRPRACRRLSGTRARPWETARDIKWLEKGLRPREDSNL